MNPIFAQSTISGGGGSTNLLTAASNWHDLQSFITFLFNTFILPLIPVLIGLSLLLFFWGMARFILHADDTKEHAAGRQYMIYGVIALFCLVSIWGILQFLSNQFEFGTVSWPFLPTGGTTPSTQSTITYFPNNN